MFLKQTNGDCRALKEGVKKARLLRAPERGEGGSDPAFPLSKKVFFLNKVLTKII